MDRPIVLKTRVIAGQQPGAHLLITAGVHGDEFEPMAAVRELIERLEGVLKKGRVTLVPCVNEAAFARGRRTADDELDLARTCPGSQTGSITERVAFAVSELIRSTDYYIDLHTGGNVLRISPLVGYTLHPESAILNAQRRLARAFGLPIIWGTTAELQGRTLSVARDAQVPAIYAEYGGGGTFDMDCVRAYVSGCLGVMAELAMLDGSRENLPPPYVVEDGRSNSGHLQLCYPAPLDGCFEPRVKLGAQVKSGDVIGVIVNILGDERVEVRSQQNGMLFCLRAFARVRKGDSLAAILEQVGSG